MDTASVSKHQAYGGTNEDHWFFCSSGLIWSQICWAETRGATYYTHQKYYLVSGGLYCGVSLDWKHK